MDAPLLLVDPDGGRRQQFEQAAHAAGLDVVVAATARAALQIASAVEPGCAVIELELPDQDGLWLTTAMRATPAIAVTPVVLIASTEGVATRALTSGVDVLLERPIEVPLVLAQVRALAAMARRIRDRKAVSSMLRRAVEDVPQPVDRGAPLVGDLGTLPPATALTILELDQRSGILELTAPGRNALSVDVVSGFVNGAMLGARSLDPTEAVREALTFRIGRFEFFGGPSRPAPPGLWPTTRLLLVAIDESDRETNASPGVTGEAAPPPPPEPAPPPLPPRPAASHRKTTLASTRAAVLQTELKRPASELVQVGEPSKPPGDPKTGAGQKG